MARCAMLFAIALTLTLCVGCGGVDETPDATQVPQVSQEEIQKNIQEGMKKGGAKQPTYQSGTAAPAN